MIDDFLKEPPQHFPEMGQSWHAYDNPIEHKYAFDDVSKMESTFQTLFAQLQSPALVEWVSRVMGIPGLESDPHLHGAGLHCTHKLGMHLDYSIHPISGKQRRVNLILFLTPEWDEGWDGSLVLYPSDPATGMMTDAEPATHIYPKFNRAVLFETSSISWHGVPHTCPAPRKARQTLAVYYVSEPALPPGERIRYKAFYARRPGEEDEYDHLREIRATRRLEPTDLG